MEHAHNLETPAAKLFDGLCDSFLLDTVQADLSARLTSRHSDGFKRSRFNRLAHWLHIERRTNYFKNYLHPSGSPQAKEQIAELAQNRETTDSGQTPIPKRWPDKSFVKARLRPRNQRSNALSCRKRLDQLTQHDLLHLTKFAERRLRLRGLLALFAEDLVFKALNSVVRGLTSQGNGRRPRAIDLVSEAAFLNYLRGAVCSTVEAFSRRREHRHVHLTIGCSRNSHEIGHDDLVAAVAGDETVEMTDLKNVIFAKLREKAPERWRRTIDLWEEVFYWAEHIPSEGSAKRARQVRMLAARILQEIDHEFHSRRLHRNGH